ncbi:ATP-binding cassette sub-family C member 4, partial [Hyalella azteca]|uniref:ATP-binding cassette sub-family C member 4 n=1 Tax=Hyalella azteca TaxID=294128 RepID=A0A8B7NM02_HYAAZ
MDQSKEKLKPNPRATASWISKLSFWWLMPLLKKGSTADLTIDDLYEVERCDASKTLCDTMERYWLEERALAAARRGKASYARALLRCFGLRYFAVGLLAAIEECVLRLVQPLVLGWLIRHFEGLASPMGSPMLSGAAIVAVALIHIVVYHPFNFLCRQLSLEARVASSALVYRKSLRLSKSALAGTTVGQMVNLLSNDVNRFDSSVIFLNYLWIGPLQLIIVTLLLWDLLGWACMAGLVVIVLFIPLQSFMGK